MSRSNYGPIVRIGNWFEDICLEQEKVNHFKHMRANGELLVEKTRRLFDNFHKEIILEAPKKNIGFGATVQLMPMAMDICDQPPLLTHPVLSVIINEKVVRNVQRINSECELTIAHSSKPCVRNSFRITSADKVDRADNNEKLKYGQQFRLQCVETENEPLYLYSIQKSPNLSCMISSAFESRKNGEINLPLGLCPQSNFGPGKIIPSACVNWFCQHIDPKKRFETNGQTLPSNQPLVITHVATNKNLAAENIITQTLFGPEYFVSVQNYRDIFKRERWQNIWTISNGQAFKY